MPLMLLNWKMYFHSVFIAIKLKKKTSMFFCQLSFYNNIVCSMTQYLSPITTECYLHSAKKVIVLVMVLWRREIEENSISTKCELCNLCLIVSFPNWSKICAPVYFLLDRDLRCRFIFNGSHISKFGLSCSSQQPGLLNLFLSVTIHCLLKVGRWGWLIRKHFFVLPANFLGLTFCCFFSPSAYSLLDGTTLLSANHNRSLMRYCCLIWIDGRFNLDA